MRSTHQKVVPVIKSARYWTRWTLRDETLRESCMPSSSEAVEDAGIHVIGTSLRQATFNLQPSLMHRSRWGMLRRGA